MPTGPSVDVATCSAQCERLSIRPLTSLPIASRLAGINGSWLASGNGIQMERDGLRVTVKVPDEVTLEIEVEIEDDEREFEITLSW